MTNFTFILCVVTLFIASSSGAPKNKKLLIKIPDGCTKEGFCSIKPEGYDALEEKMNKLLPPIKVQDVADRIGPPLPFPDIEADEDNCPGEYSSESIYFYKHGDKVTDVDIIVQTKSLPQRIDKYTCAYNRINVNSEGKECMNELGLNSFLKFSCQQIYSKRTLLVFDPDDGRIKPKSYPVPVCCSCKISNR